MKKLFYKWIFFKMMGWKIVGTINPEIKKCVMMVMPHTSAHDFYLGIFTRGILGLEMNFVAKKELFRFPFGYYFRWMGGAPIDRTGSLNKVDAIASEEQNAVNASLENSLFISKNNELFNMMLLTILLLISTVHSVKFLVLNDVHLDIDADI